MSRKSCHRIFRSKANSKFMESMSVLCRVSYNVLNAQHANIIWE